MGDADVPTIAEVSGFAATTSLGSVTALASAKAIFAATGIVGTGATGSVNIESRYDVTGVVGTTGVGFVVIYSGVLTNQVGIYTQVVNSVNTIYTEKQPVQNATWVEVA